MYDLVWLFLALYFLCYGAALIHHLYKRLTGRGNRDGHGGGYDAGGYDGGSFGVVHRDDGGGGDCADAGGGDCADAGGGDCGGGGSD